MNFERINQILSELSVLPFYPSDPSARLAIARMVGNMAHSEAQVRWLVTLMTSGAFSKWEGPSELRAVFCMKFKPKDGIETTSAVFPDGLSREQLNPGKPLQIDAASPQVQISGRVEESAIVDPELAALVERVASARCRPLPHVQVDTTVHHEESELSALMRSVEDFRGRVKPTSPRIVTQTEIDAIKNEQERNRKEKGL